ncbi:MAG TPA: tyrosine-type recombinase/integrase [Actinomycetota bacterium]|jgi:integrase/recombinase XerC|nr:tyrosine-type recombinase/integrase [Actinomycetota bacterium]
MRTSTHLPDFARYLTISRGLSPATVHIYCRHVHDYLNKDGLGLRDWLEARSASPSSFTQRTGALKAWARFAKDRELALALADIDRPKRAKGLPRPVPDWRDRIAFATPQTAAVATFLAETGLRLSEACSVAVGVPVGTELRVLGKGRKERILPLTEAARAALTALGGRMPWGPRAIERRLGALGFTPHQLRHQRATSLIQAGADIGDVQKLLGHASPATTMIYAAFSTERLRDVLERAAGV